MYPPEYSIELNVSKDSPYLEGINTGTANIDSGALVTRHPYEFPPYVAIKRVFGDGSVVEKMFALKNPDPAAANYKYPPGELVHARLFRSGDIILARVKNPSLKTPRY